jgi:hypothetical protein
MLNKHIEAIIQASELTTAKVDIGGEEYSLFIQRCSDGLYSVDFGGRLGDLEAVSDLLSRLDLKQFCN